MRKILATFIRLLIVLLFPIWISIALILLCLIPFEGIFEYIIKGESHDAGDSPLGNFIIDIPDNINYFINHKIEKIL